MEPMTAALSLVSTRRRQDPGLLERLATAASAIRALSIAAIYHAGSGHPGGSLSAADLLATLYGAEMNVWPTRVGDPNRDRFVLSKGHAAPALYAAGAHFGFCAPEEALTLRKLGSPFQGHPHARDLSWVETSTGSLGQGFSVALGMSMGLKFKKNPARVYAILGDGELQEGEVWEAAMCAAHHKLDNLLAIVDYNKLQSDDLNANIMGLEPLADKFRAFGWQVQEIDGHDFGEILAALEQAFEEIGRPSVIIAHTIKGKGVPFMEKVPHWHGSVKLTRQQAEDSLIALGRSKSEISRWLDGSR
jgi:transketolase